MNSERKSKIINPKLKHGSTSPPKRRKEKF